MYMDKTYIDGVNKTYSKQCSRRQMLPKFIIDQPLPKDCVVLDYGAGKDGYGTQILRDYFYDVVAYDIGKNFVEDLHDVNALDKQYYDVIMMSNIINIQPSVSDAIAVLKEVKECLRPFGSVYCNLPKSPRKCDLNEDILQILMKGIFEEVYLHKNNIFEGERVC